MKLVYSSTLAHDFQVPAGDNFMEIGFCDFLSSPLPYLLPNPTPSPSPLFSTLPFPTLPLPRIPLPHPYPHPNLPSPPSPPLWVCSRIWLSLGVGECGEEAGAAGLPECPCAPVPSGRPRWDRTITALGLFDNWCCCQVLMFCVNGSAVLPPVFLWYLFKCWCLDGLDGLIS